MASNAWCCWAVRPAARAELTHDINALLPLVIGCVSAHTTTVLLLKRSILTEKIARRGHHITREYVVDPFETLGVAAIMVRIWYSVTTTSWPGIWPTAWRSRKSGGCRS